jgi:hypothetical protein
MEDIMPEYVGDVSVRYISRPEDVPNELEFNHSLMAQCEIDSLRSEIINLQDQRDLAMKVIKRLEEEREEWYFKAHANFNLTLDARAERDEAREKYTTLLTDNMLDVHKLYKAIELIKSLINQIERPAYGVDEAVAKMFLMEDAKKFANEVQ